MPESKGDDLQRLTWRSREEFTRSCKTNPFLTSNSKKVKYFSRTQNEPIFDRWHIAAPSDAEA